MWKLARTLTGYYIAVLVVFAILNMIAWLADAPPRYSLGVFSAGFLMGALGMYIAAYLYGLSKCLARVGPNLLGLDTRKFDHVAELFDLI